MYRPFISCDDPKGVVECGTIRKCRTSSQKMKGKAKSRRTAEDTETSLASKPGRAERSFDPSSSLRLMEVSIGAQRLNNMIDSWSMGLRYGARSEDIAKDLLRGALDLQESLVMLRKVQEASQDTARLKRKQNEMPASVRGRIDAKMVDKAHFCNQFSEPSYPMGFQRPWPSADGSSSSCREELKRVIKESLVRQNLIPGTNTEEALDSGSASEFHSTSSSQSSWFQNERLSDSSFSPTMVKKEQGPSLVARLMGLEEAPPSRSFPAATQKQLGSEKIVNQKRPVFEIDMPRVRKSDGPMVEKVYPERQKTLRELLETTHFNGLSKSSSAREHKHQIHHKQFDDLPPIVLIKPRCTPFKEFARVHEPVPQEEFSIRKLKAKPVPSKTFKQREGATTNMGKEQVSRRVTKEERAELLREVVEPDAKELKPVENEKAPRGKVKPYSHVSKKSQESESVEKKAKVKPISKKTLEKEIPKPKIVTKSQDHGEISFPKLRKPQGGSRIDKSEIRGRKSTASIAISKTRNQKTNSKEQIKNQMKKQRPVAEPEAAKPVDEQLGQGQEEKSIDVSCKDDCTEIRIIGTVADDLGIDHEEDASSNKIKEDCHQRQSSLGDDIIMLKSELENGAIHAKEAHHGTNDREADWEPDKEGAKLKRFLLTSQSFIEHAEELLNLDVDCPKVLTTKSECETDGIANCRLYLDCANELTERESFQGSQEVVHPLLLLNCVGNSRLHISLGRLVEEICVAIENLRSYSENCGKKVPLDNIYAMMERDIKCSGMVNGIWNLGWRHGFSADEAEQVVNEVESLVLSGLIEEVIVNL